MKQDFYTKEEVLSEIAVLSEELGLDISLEPVEIEGFECIFNFCKLESGWVNSGMDYSSYSVAHAVKKMGSKTDKIKFNQISSLGKEFMCPLNKKEEALDKKRLVKRKKKEEGWRDDKVRARDLRLKFRDYKKFGISSFGRGKGNLEDNVFSFVSFNMPEDSGVWVGHVFVEGLRPMKSYPMVDSIEYLISCINSEIKRQELKFGVKARFDESNIKNISFNKKT